MRRAFLVVFVVASLLLPPVGGVDFPRHVDPALLELDNPNPVQLFEVYEQIYEYVVASNYSDARTLLEQLGGVEARRDVEGAMDEYNGLLMDAVHELNLTERGIDMAYSSLEWLRELEAESSLNASKIHLLMANASSVGLWGASSELAGALRESPAGLLDEVEELEAFIDELNREILEGVQEVERIKTLRLEGISETRLELMVDNPSPPVGSTVKASGSLRVVNGSGLAGRRLRLLLDGGETQEAWTVDGGAFLFTLNLPYVYEGHRLKMVYKPEGVDVDVYTPAVSDTVYLDTQYFTPILTLEGPTMVYPGRNFTVKGVVAPYEALGGAGVRVSFMGTRRRVVPGGDGGYAVELFTPSYAEEGDATVTASISPVGTYGPASMSIRVMVVREPLGLSVEEPRLVFSGRSAVISGTVSTAGAPLAGCMVRISLGGDTLAAVTDVGGRFGFEYPVDVLSFSARRRYSVTASPREPWIAEGALQGGFLLINSVVAAALPLLALVAVVTRRKPAPVAPEAGWAPAAPPPYPELSGLPGVYVKAVQVVTDVTGVRLAPSHTIREYLEGVRPVLRRRLAALFERISMIYEKWLYSGRGGRPPLKTQERNLERLRDRVEADKS